MTQGPWTTERIRQWVESEAQRAPWYQRIPIRDGIVTPGRADSLRRLAQLRLPDDLKEKCVLDVGCNSGMLCFECERRNAGRVVGTDLNRMRLQQARTLAEIMELDVEFIELDLFRAPSLGRFDIVFCIAVLTEVRDVVGGLEVLKQITAETLYLELATLETYPGGRRNLGARMHSLLARLFRRADTAFRGTAKLRRIDSEWVHGWSIVPDRELLHSVMGPEFHIIDLGMSARYNLFKMTRKEGAAPGRSP